MGRSRWGAALSLPVATKACILLQFLLVLKVLLDSSSFLLLIIVVTDTERGEAQIIVPTWVITIY